MEILMDIDRRSFLLGGSAAALTLTVNFPAFSKAPPLSAQISGAQHFNVGDITVSALSDGSIAMDPSLFPTANKDELQQAVKRAFVGHDGKITGAVNAYVARLADKTVLIDSGSGSLLGPTAGMLPQQLTAAAVAPADVDVLALTHLHPDHVGGLVGMNDSTAGSPILGSSATGLVTAQPTNGYSGSILNYTGGLVGYNNGSTITNSCAWGRGSGGSN